MTHTAWAPLGLLLGAFLASCSHGTLQAESVKLTSPQQPTILVLQSQKNDLSNAVLRGLADNTDANVVSVCDVEKIDPADLEAMVLARAPDLVLALGRSAAQFSRAHLKTPRIFALVLNYRGQDLAAQGMMGISMESAPVSEFTQFKMIMPGLRHVLAPYQDPKMAAVLQDTARELEALGVVLTPVAVRDEAGLLSAVDAAEGMDAVWICSDPFVLGRAKTLLDAASTRHMLVINSVSARLARAGALASVAVDIGSIGQQAAVMANAVLFSHASVEDIGIQTPMGTRLVVNATVAKQHGLSIPLDVLPFVGEIATDVTALP